MIIIRRYSDQTTLLYLSSEKKIQLEYLQEQQTVFLLTFEKHKGGGKPEIKSILSGGKATHKNGDKSTLLDCFFQFYFIFARSHTPNRMAVVVPSVH